MGVCSTKQDSIPERVKRTNIYDTEMLFLSCSEIQNTELAHFCNRLVTDPKSRITQLYLSNNTITSFGCNYLANLIARIEKIWLIDICNNPIHLAGYKLLFYANKNREKPVRFLIGSSIQFTDKELDWITEQINNPSKYDDFTDKVPENWK